jgi:hypothetical protein
MAGMGEVTLGTSHHLPTHGIATPVSSREHRASQAEKMAYSSVLREPGPGGVFARTQRGSEARPSNQTEADCMVRPYAANQTAPKHS